MSLFVFVIECQKETLTVYK